MFPLAKGARCYALASIRMNASREDILAVVRDAVAEINELRSAAEQIGSAEETVLLGESGGLDSLGVINLVSAIEERLAKRYGVAITIPAGGETTGQGDPWRNVGALTDFLWELVKSR
ncbi:MAG: acyl carrier protein [Opitutaceae bacterium]|nr:acyl carrier protein [Opitutaceae bacterium]